jgi:tRNA nucleotidyltransferase (CCA-adding enzyme)
MCLVTVGKPREIKEFVEELLKFLGKWELHQKLKDWKVPRFPVDGNILKSHNCPSGKIMGTIINKLKEEWVKNEFKPSADELLLSLPKILEELNIVDGKQVKKPKTQ